MYSQTTFFFQWLFLVWTWHKSVANWSVLWSSSDYEVAQVQISLILHFIPYNTTDLPCGLCSVTCKFIFYFYYLWNQGSSWLFNIVDTGRRILILEKRGHTWWPSRIRIKSMKGQKGTSDKKKGKFRLRGTGGRLVLSCRNGKNYSKSERKEMLQIKEGKEVEHKWKQWFGERWVKSWSWKKAKGWNKEKCLFSSLSFVDYLFFTFETLPFCF